MAGWLDMVKVSMDQSSNLIAQKFHSNYFIWFCVCFSTFNESKTSIQRFDCQNANNLWTIYIYGLPGMVVHCCAQREREWEW